VISSALRDAAAPKTSRGTPPLTASLCGTTCRRPCGQAGSACPGHCHPLNTSEVGAPSHKAAKRWRPQILPLIPQSILRCG
jgi:hypothetical protein